MEFGFIASDRPGSDVDVFQTLSAYQVGIILEALRSLADAQARCGMGCAAIDTAALGAEMRKSILMAAQLKAADTAATVGEILAHEQRQSTIFGGG